LTEHTHVDRATARKTALTVATVLFAAGSWQVYLGRPTAATIFISLAVLLTVVAFIPPLAIGFHRGWMAIAAALGYVNTRILLSIVYYLVLTPMGVWRRLTGHDPLSRRAKGQPSYWIQRTSVKQTHEGFKRAF